MRKKKKIEKEGEVVELTDMKKEKKGSFITMQEIIYMKAFLIQGMSISAIGRKLGRHKGSVERSLKLLEEVLPDENDLQNMVSERVAEITERQFQNAERIICAADLQVMRKIHEEETSAADAARIRKVYGDILNPALGIASVENESGEKNPTIVNFINMIVKVKEEQKHDRLGPTTRDEGGVRGDDGGGKKDSIEGVVLE